MDKVYGVAQNIDSNTLSLQYFDTLQKLGESSSTKFIFPMEFTNLLRPFTGGMQRGASGDAAAD